MEHACWEAGEVTDAESPLRDVALDDEITLVGDLVVAATSHDRPLTLAEIDLALGLLPPMASTG